MSLLFLSVLACGGGVLSLGPSEPPAPDTGRSGADADADADADTDSDSDADADSDTDSDADADSDADTDIAVQLSCYGDSSCALFGDGTVSCWGKDDYGTVSEAPPDSGWIHVEAGYSNACAMNEVKEISCWGSNGNEQSAPPADPQVDFCLGPGFGCALNGSGEITCWGNGDSRIISNKPTGTAYRGISCGWSTACVIDGADKTVCWGKDRDGLADGSRLQAHEVSISYAHGCAVVQAGADRAVECWGPGPGNEDRTEKLSGLSAGRDFNCALTDLGAVDCWGDDAHGQLSAPAPGDYPWVQVNAGTSHACAISEDGEIACWGDDSLGQASP